mmetsp:Transcript_45407/g.120418  ORF Transcript_45407/g.120418 Transcript_45407/m.120418 type:complete len:201 (-) Transcript_45407:67-669(-)
MVERASVIFCIPMSGAKDILAPALEACESTLLLANPTPGLVLLLLSWRALRLHSLCFCFLLIRLFSRLLGLIFSLLLITLLLLHEALGAIIVCFGRAEKPATPQTRHRSNGRGHLSGGLGSAARRSVAARAFHQEELAFVGDVRRLQRLFVPQKLPLEEQPLLFHSKPTLLRTLFLELRNCDERFNGHLHSLHGAKGLHG